MCEFHPTYWRQFIKKIKLAILLSRLHLVSDNLIVSFTWQSYYSERLHYYSLWLYSRLQSNISDVFCCLLLPYLTQLILSMNIKMKITEKLDKYIPWFTNYNSILIGAGTNVEIYLRTFANKIFKHSKHSVLAFKLSFVVFTSIHILSN